MCISLIAIHASKRYPLAILHNRDEYYERPTTPLAPWQTRPDVYAAQDLKAGGIFLGVTRSRRFGLITNYRDPKLRKEEAPSRGHILASYLFDGGSPAEFLENLKASSDLYSPFNLILGDHQEVHYYSSVLKETRQLQRGIYTLSNAHLDSDWPKTALLKDLTLPLLQDPNLSEAELKSRFLHLLSHGELAPDSKLPNTGLPLEQERVLSSIFVRSPVYGTVSSTVLLQQADSIDLTEVSYGREWVTGTRAYHIPLAEPGSHLH